MQQVTNEELAQWMDAARIGPRDLADRLAANGHAVTPQRVSQWRSGDPISEFWQSCIRQVMAQVDAADSQRVSERLAGSVAA